MPLLVPQLAVIGRGLEATELGAHRGIDQLGQIMRDLDIRAQTKENIAALASRILLAPDPAITEMSDRADAVVERNSLLAMGLIDATLARRRAAILMEADPSLLERGGTSLTQIFDLMHSYGYSGYSIDHRDGRLALGLIHICMGWPGTLRLRAVSGPGPGRETPHRADRSRTTCDRRARRRRRRPARPE